MLSERTIRAVNTVDAMPAGLRGCVHEYGYAIVEAMRQAGVSSPRAIHNLMREIWFGARQPQQRTGRKKGVRSPICDQLDWLLMQSGSSLNAEGLARALKAANMVIVPLEPTDAMMGASMDATNHMGVVTKREKHRNRLRAANQAGARQFWPLLDLPAHPSSSGSRP